MAVKFLKKPISWKMFQISYNFNMVKQFVAMAKIKQKIKKKNMKQAKSEFCPICFNNEKKWQWSSTAKRCWLTTW